VGTGRHPARGQSLAAELRCYCWKFGLAVLMS